MSNVVSKLSAEIGDYSHVRSIVEEATMTSRDYSHVRRSSIVVEESPMMMMSLVNYSNRISVMEQLGKVAKRSSTRRTRR